MKKQLLTTGLSLLMLFPLYGNAQETSSSSTASGSSTIATEQEGGANQSFTLCSQAAIEVRDTRIAASRATYNVAMTKALNTRKNNEKAAVALSLEDEKKDAIKLSVDTYKNQVKAAQNALVQARKEAWQTFENDIKKCRELQEGSHNKVVKEGETELQTATMSKKTETLENKSIKDTIKSQLESLKSLFN